MKNTRQFGVLFAMAFAGMLASCDPGDGGDGPFYDYRFAIKNQSDVPLRIEGWRTRDLATGNVLDTPLLLHAISLAAGAQSSPKDVTLMTPLEQIPIIYPGFENNTDSLAVTFGDFSRGYYVLDRTEGFYSSAWIQGRGTLLNFSTPDLQADGNTQVYIFTQSEADSAPDL